MLAGEAAAEAAPEILSGSWCRGRSGAGAAVPRHRRTTAAAAFFDLDNTVMQGAAIFHFGRGLYKRKFFQSRDLARFAWQQA